MTTLKIAAAVAALCVLTSDTTFRTTNTPQKQIAKYKEAAVDLSARRRHRHRITRLDASGNRVSSTTTIYSGKTGAKATVSVAYAEKFQAYIDELEEKGAVIKFMGGVRRGHCSSGHMHPCGRALDVCQLSRGRVDASCNLPSRVAIAAIASKHGLFEGGQWCNQDYGHAQAGVSAPACGGSMLARRSTHRTYAARTRVRHHYARTYRRTYAYAGYEYYYSSRARYRYYQQAQAYPTY